MLLQLKLLSKDFWEINLCLENAQARIQVRIKPDIFLGVKVHIFCEGHKILRNLLLTFDCMYCSQKLAEDFAKFCGPLRIYELYLGFMTSHLTGLN